MIDVKYKYNCCGCKGCLNICAKGAITFKCDSEGFYYPHIEKEKCTNCGLCNSVCPFENNHFEEKEIDAYACYNKDTFIRKNSSSGGIFHLLAQSILNRGGYVFGAAFDDKYNVIHIGVNNKDELIKLRGSKYVQSDLGNVYKDIENLLKKGIEVLFTGTPCQVDALKFFLRKDYNNLYTQDVICHGVPSQQLWHKYLNEIVKDSNILNISFRDKKISWEEFCMTIETDKLYYSKKFMDDPYMMAFMQNISLRPSCYKCKSKSKFRTSDITLADFWGIDKMNYNIKDKDNGVSLMLINSPKGKTMFENIKEYIFYNKVDFELGIKENTMLFQSVKENPSRKKFLSAIKNRSIQQSIQFANKPNLYIKFKIFIYNILKILFKKSNT